MSLCKSFERIILKHELEIFSCSFPGISDSLHYIPKSINISLFLKIIGHLLLLFLLKLMILSEIVLINQINIMA
jgi:hypothetical protein